MSRAVRAIVCAGLLAGALDIGYVFVYFHRADPLAILRGIAAGLLGPGARQGGLGTAALGLACHFTIALGAAAVFYAASRKFAVLVRRPWVAGPLYGAVVWLVMNLVVLPLSANPPKSFPAPNWIPILVAHLTCVGLPIALVVARCAKVGTDSASSPDPQQA
ncbi:MAG: hypothetical protein HZA93_24265 [Verrucomicrobia bacterium]|nr:hypothetical protein [Verrucomicrobiota bacterium]